MAGSVSVGGRVPVGRVVATADVATFQADPQVQPRRADGETLRAPVNLLGQLRDVDVVQMGARAGHAVTLARPEQFVDHDANQDHRLVFCQQDGTPLHPNRVSKLFARHVDALGATRITLHGLRHTWASLALQAGINPKVVSERLGHATVSFTLDTYSHLMPGLQEDAAARVARLVFNA
jgi:integrase